MTCQSEQEEKAIERVQPAPSVHLPPLRSDRVVQDKTRQGNVHLRLLGPEDSRGKEGLNLFNITNYEEEQSATPRLELGAMGEGFISTRRSWRSMIRASEQHRGRLPSIRIGDEQIRSIKGDESSGRDGEQDDAVCDLITGYSRPEESTPKPRVVIQEDSSQSEEDFRRRRHLHHRPLMGYRGFGASGEHLREPTELVNEGDQRPRAINVSKLPCRSSLSVGVKASPGQQEGTGTNRGGRRSKDGGIYSNGDPTGMKFRTPMRLRGPFSTSSVVIEPPSPLYSSSSPSSPLRTTPRPKCRKFPPRPGPAPTKPLPIPPPLTADSEGGRSRSTRRISSRGKSRLERVRPIAKPSRTGGHDEDVLPSPLFSIPSGQTKDQKPQQQSRVSPMSYSEAGNQTERIDSPTAAAAAAANAEGLLEYRRSRDQFVHQKKKSDLQVYNALKEIKGEEQRHSSTPTQDEKVPTTVIQGQEHDEQVNRGASTTIATVVQQKKNEGLTTRTTMMLHRNSSPTTGQVQQHHQRNEEGRKRPGRQLVVVDDDADDAIKSIKPNHHQGISDDDTMVNGAMSARIAALEQAVRILLLGGCRSAGDVSSVFVVDSSNGGGNGGGGGDNVENGLVLLPGTTLPSGGGFSSGLPGGGLLSNGGFPSPAIISPNRGHDQHGDQQRVEQQQQQQQQQCWSSHSHSHSLAGHGKGFWTTTTTAAGDGGGEAGEGEGEESRGYQATSPSN